MSSTRERDESDAPDSRGGSGDWLIESSVVAAAVSILCVFGVPSLHGAIERARALEAVEYLAAVRHAQERHLLRYGSYAETLRVLRLHRPLPAAFEAGPMHVGAGDAGAGFWKMTLVRKTEALGYGRYTITFSDRGFEPAKSTVDRFLDVDHVSLRPTN